MSTSVIEPGTRLAGRYRLEERISDTGGSCLWKAIDEILARAVAVRTFDPEFPRIAEVVTAARAASRLTDPRLTQVFDADDSGESAYVVSEWVVGETLEQMLAKAPLEPGRAATLLYEAAEAVAAAHAAGLAHLCLSPRELVWTTGGTVKVLGVATDAVLGDRYGDDPAADDVRGLGAMLYAALTARWPGDPDCSALPAAPLVDGLPEAPRQVQAGIAQGINDIVCRCLGVEVPGYEPLARPADFVKALRGVPRTPLPLFAGLGNVQTSPRVPRPAPAPTTPTPQPPSARSQHREPAQSFQQGPPPASAPTAPSAHPPHNTGGAPRKSPNRALIGVAAAALTVIAGLGAWAVSNGGEDPKPRATTGITDNKTKQSQPPKPTPVKLQAQNATAAEDPINGHYDHTITKRPDAVIDGKDAAVWETQSYASTNFGNYSRGLGVLLDMGRPVKVAKVQVSGVEGGGTLQVRVGDTTSPTSLTPIGKKASDSGETTIEAEGTSGGRYVLVWFTKLPPSLKGRIGEITIYGTPAS
ncbi:protein kinase family protein [Actinomadura macrotermitis]|uniref:Protein kinase domain-containing protein n=1 Tax=Actinomadura macrotermitis TaxID=2585200 RepID=A0A7K0BVU4_9ACTN|nr:protein kinase family protein [Actinomadura macrotermitis]MQY05300.1 hypothetical protein [Actinomadura macrotermitis]